MSSFRPLSRRRDPTYDEPQEGLPDYLIKPVLDWLQKIVEPYNTYGEATELLSAAQVRLRMSPPLDWRQGHVSAWQSLMQRIIADREFGLDLVDFFLHLRDSVPSRSELSGVLLGGGSVWEVEALEGGGSQLTRRATGPVSEAIEAVRSESERAHHHLRMAWGHLMGRDPDPSAAYREAIRAVEAAAKPVVLPNDPTATLGKMIGALRDKPEKWDFALADASAKDVAHMCNLIWKSQFDRHGTDDESVPLTVSQKEADAAFHIALTLVRLFAGRLIRRS